MILKASETRIFPPLHTEVNKGHGRIETRTIRISTAVNDYLDFPYVGQVAHVHRKITDLDGKPIRKEENVYLITSLSSQKASPKQLLELNRNHWHIENKLHYVRDVTFNEDRSRIRKKNGPHVMASIKNLVISLFRKATCHNIAKAIRDCSWNFKNALRLIGIVLI